MATAIDERDEDLRLLRIDQVLELVPVARSSLYRNIEAGQFPRPIKMSGCSLWVNNDIRRWLRERRNSRSRDNGDVV